MPTEEKDELGNTIWANPALMPLMIGDEEVYRCPRRPLLDDPQYWSQLLFYYGLFKNGHLPDPGAVSDQSFKAMNLFGILDEISEDCMRKQAEDKASAAAAARQRG